MCTWPHRLTGAENHLMLPACGRGPLDPLLTIETGLSTRSAHTADAADGGAVPHSAMMFGYRQKCCRRRCCTRQRAAASSRRATAASCRCRCTTPSASPPLDAPGEATPLQHACSSAGSKLHNGTTCQCMSISAGVFLKRTTSCCKVLAAHKAPLRSSTYAFTCICSQGFIKRDGRPKESETLVSRLVDRSLRPAFASGWSADTQVSTLTKKTCKIFTYCAWRWCPAWCITRCGPPLPPAGHPTAKCDSVDSAT